MKLQQKMTNFAQGSCKSTTVLAKAVAFVIAGHFHAVKK